MSTASDFALIAATPVPALRLTLEEYRHPIGAVHFHLACEDEHRAFMVSFRTPPGDDCGLPHILEHTTLCGSRRYPVRDPFFKMLRRSLQTFMNAMTFPDMTCYPFASQVAKDFDNLLGIYLDAVFRPLLDPLDFAQEGHRLEPASDGSGWQRKGVVFNEMKGAMDSTASQVEGAIPRALLPATCYAFNSGGEPAAIPALRHRDLVAFHRRCYHPANACFTTFGNQPPAQLHQRLAPYLDVAPAAPVPPPARQPPLRQAQILRVPVPLSGGQDVLDVAAAGLHWVWGDIADLDEALTAELLDRLLYGHAGAPLRLRLENSGLGRSIGGSGFHSSYRNGLFSAELDGLDPADYGKLEPLVLGELERIAGVGFTADEVHAALDQLELARREISGDSYPYGLELALRLAMAWNLGAKPLAFLDQAPAIVRLRQRAQTPGFLGDELRRRLLDNPHRALVLAEPEPGFHAAAAAREREQVERDLAALDAVGQDRLRREAADLAERQGRAEDADILPDLELADVPAQRRWASGTDAGGGLTTFAASTNGLLHHLAALPVPALGERELDLLPLLAEVIGNLGVGRRSYTEQAARLNACCGGLWSWIDIVADPDDAGKLRAFLYCEVKGLADKHGEFTGLIAETLASQRGDEAERLAELVEQGLQRLQDRVQSAGSAFASRAATRGFAGAAGLSHRLSGLGRLGWLKQLVAGEETDIRVAARLGEELHALLGRLRAGPLHLALVGDAAERAEVIAEVRRAWTGSGGGTSTALAAAPASAQPATAFTTASAVSYCALAFPTVPLGHHDAAALAVAGRYLTNNFLHPRLREQGGAYGANANYQGSTGAFSLTSYRDPRLAATLADMRAGLGWLAAIADEPRLVREAILGVIAGVDAPSSPAGEAKARFAADLKGAGPERLNPFRQRVLAVTAADLRQIAQRWLPADGGSAAVITSGEALAASGLDWASEAI